jgi:transposase
MKTTENYTEKTKEELIQLIAQQARQIHILEEYIKAYQLRQFGNKSEKLNQDQINLFDEAALPKNAETILAVEEEISVASYTRSKNKVGRKALPADLPRVPHIYDLQDAEKICACGCELTHISDEKSEQLEIIPAKVYVIEHIKKKYACKKCEETIKTAKMPTLPIPRSIASAGLLSHVLVSKFQDGLPLYRQEKILKRIGIDIPRATLCLWVLKCAELLKPLLKLLHDYIISYDVAYADETTVQVLKEPNKGVQSKKYMWLFSGGSPDKFVFYYQYHPSRSHDVCENFFADFKGYLHCDGFTAYDTLTVKHPDIILSGCMYHARRKFVEVTKITKSTDGVSHQAIKYIEKLAFIEEQIKALTSDEKFIHREEKSRPILIEMHEYLVAQQPSIPPKSLLGQAVSYTLNQWSKLLTYLKDGRLENNNNRSERAIKPFVIGRKAWLFADSVEGAHAAATIFSFIETCKHHQIEPYYWFKYVLQTLPSCQTLEEFEALLPFNIDRNLLR